MRINELLPVVDKYSTMFEKHWNYASESVKTPSIDKETAFNDLTDQFVYIKYIRSSNLFCFGRRAIKPLEENLFPLKHYHIIIWK